MDNPMLAELDEVKWLRDAAAGIALEGHAGWGNACIFGAECIERLQSTLADMAKRLEAAERKCGAYPNSEQTAAAYREYLSLNDDDADKAKQDLGTLVMGWHAAMTIAATQEGEG